MPRDKNKTYLRAPKANYKPETVTFSVRLPVALFKTSEENQRRIKEHMTKKVKIMADEILARLQKKVA